jgi:hypothetical protein
MAEMIFAFECQLDDTWEEKYWTGEWGKPDFIKSEKEYPNPVTGRWNQLFRSTKALANATGMASRKNKNVLLTDFDCSANTIKDFGIEHAIKYDID